jgi:hypothetical protein
MNRTIKSLVTATTATAALAAVLFSAGGASAATLPTHETHWAGYYATAGTQPIYMAVATVTIPRDATCNNVVGLPPLRPYRGAYWVGIGGMNGPGDPDARLNGGKVSLEQTGVEMYCARRYATPEFALFWEIVPDASPKYDGVNLGWPGVNHVVDVHPGNTVSMEVDSPGWVDISGHAGQYRMTITVNPGSDHSSTYTQWRGLKRGYVTGHTVEATTEWETCASTAPGAGSLSCGLPDVGTARFTYAGYVTRIPGDPKPVPVPIPQHKLEMKPLAQLGVRWTPVYAGPAGPSNPSDPYDTQHTAFTTYWNGWGSR